MTLEVGDKVALPGDAKQGIVREVEWHGVTIHWPQAFGWFSGDTVYYRNSEVKKWEIEKAQ